MSRVYAVSSISINDEGNPQTEVLAIVRSANIHMFLYKLKVNPSRKWGVLAERIAAGGPIQHYLVSAHDTPEQAKAALLPAILQYAPTCMERL